MHTQMPPATNQTPYPYTQQNDEISLIELWQAIWQRKLTLFITTLIAVIVGIIYVSRATSIYQAEVLLSPTTVQKSTGHFAAFSHQYPGLADLAGIALPRHSSLNTAIATLKSRQFIQAFIQDNNLRPLLFPKQWNKDTKSWKTHRKQSNIWRLFSNQGAALPETLEPNLEQAYKKFKAALSVSIDKKTDLVNLHFNWPKPEVAARWSNQIVIRINQVLRKQAITKAESSITYLNGQLKKTQLDELRLLYSELIQEQTKNITLAKANEEYAFAILDPAIIPENPVKPKHKMILLLSLISGLILGVIIALIRHAVQNHRQKMALANTPQHLPQ